MIVLYGISIAFLIAYSALIFFYRQSWLAIPEIDPAPNGILHRTKISVIIPARNEEQNISACLHSIYKQNYPAHLFEVIVVDDHSTDKTIEQVNSFASKGTKLIELKHFSGNEKLNSYKKKAIEVAIQQSSGTLIVTTDADCIVPATWLQVIASAYEQQKPAFIAAPVAYHSENSFLKKFQSLDFMTLQGITGASVYKKFHSMCNGANLAYEKEAFHEVNGFKGIDNIASGDDMLLMHKIYQRYPGRVIFLKSKEAIVQTEAMQTIADFFQQRIRWASKSGKYEDKRMFAVLVLVYFFNVWIFLLGIIALIDCIIHQQISTSLLFFIGLGIAKTITDLFFSYPVAKFFSKQNLLWWFPVAQPFHIAYTIIAGWLGKFGTYKWKERTLR